MKKLFTLKTILLAFMCVMGVGSSWGADYVKITSLDGLKSGADYLIVYESSSTAGKAMTTTATTTSTKRLTPADVTISSSKITTTATNIVWTLSGSTDAWMFNNGTNYVSGTGSGAANCTGTSSTGNKYDITANTDGTFHLQIHDNADRVLEYNTGGPYFAHYKSTQADICLYKKVTPTGPVDPTITTTNKIVTVSDVIDVTDMFSSNSTGTITYSITGVPEGAVENTDYMFDNNEFYATKVGDYTVTASQAAVANTYNAKTATATITVAATKTVTITAPSNGTIVVKNGENTLESGAKVLEGTQLQISATPSSGYAFTSWDITGATPASFTEKTTSLTVGASDITIAANFEETTDITVTYNFNDAYAYPSGFPTEGTTTATAQTFNISGNDIIINAPNAYYEINSKTDASRGLFFGKTTAANSIPTAGTAYLGFPARYGYKLTKVEVTTTSVVAGSVKLNIYDASWSAYSTVKTTTGSKKETFTFALSNTKECTEYRLASGSSGKNLQFDNIVLTYEKVNYHNLTISAAGYATFYDSEHAYTMPDDCEGYVFTATGGLSKVYDAESVVPAGEPLVIYTIEPGTKTLTFTTSSEDTYKSLGDEYNALYGTDEATALTADANSYFYGLAAKDSKVGFYWMADGGAEFTNGAHKAYLKLAKSNGAKSAFPFNLDETTAISNANVDVNVNNAPAYNLAGQRVNANAKGIVIMNGKKYINK